MRGIICILLSIMPLLASAQQYKPFIEFDKYWDIEIVSGESICFTIQKQRYFFAEDTIVDNKRYFKLAYHQFLYNPDAPPFCEIIGVSRDTLYTTLLFREDEEEQEVYRRNSDQERPESLVYDFSVQLGDTLLVTCDASIFPYIVDSIATEILYEKERRVFYNNVNNELTDGPYTEGIGFSSPFFFPCITPDIGIGTECVFYGDFERTHNCDSFITATENILSDSEINIFPNPVSDFLYLDGLTVGSRVQIFNNNGLQIFSADYHGSFEYLDLSMLDAGIYFLVSTNKSGRVTNRSHFLKL